MKPEDVAERVKRGAELWGQLANRLKELNLPGSRYLPNEFLAALLLAEFSDETPEEIARRIALAREQLRGLRQRSELQMALLSDPASVLTLALMMKENGAPAPESMPELAPEPKLLTQCPHCDHEFGRCEAREYVQPAEAPPQAPPKPALLTTCPHVDEHGQCLECSSIDNICCSGGCVNDFFAIHGKKCKLWDDCGNIYCPNCVSEISTRGYCPNCTEIECNNCGDNIERGTEHACARLVCRNQTKFCSDCASRLLNLAGLCVGCSGQEEIACHDCRLDFIESRLTACDKVAECDNRYCSKCAPKALQNGLCGSCES